MAQSGEAGSARAMEIWLLPFAGMFTQPSWLNAVALATGALLCLNRRTVCAALRAVCTARGFLDTRCCYAAALIGARAANHSRLV